MANEAPSKPKSVVDFYLLACSLKNVIRRGWIVWSVKQDRLESIAEHIYGTQMLAIAIYSQYDYKIDIARVITMLAVHELEEIVIGDLTQWDIPADEKLARGHNAVKQILQGLLRTDEIEKLVLEFDDYKTPEARFARDCDKLEAGIQAKIYDTPGAVDLSQQSDNKIMNDENVQKLLNEGNSWSAMWLKFHRETNKYSDDNFNELSKWVETTTLQKTY